MKCVHANCKQDPCYDDAAWHMQLRCWYCLAVLPCNCACDTNDEKRINNMKKCGCEKNVFACREHAHPQPTPAPWKETVYYATDSVRIYSDSNPDIADVTGSNSIGKANAAYIVKCVNSHDELCGKLDYLYATLKTLHKVLAEKDDSECIETCINLVERALDKVEVK